MSLRQLALLAAATVTVAGLISCSVTFTDTVTYVCTTDADCGGDGFTCAPNPTRSVCCKATGVEVCDQVDNDCDGFVDNTGTQEACNGLDDDCNGLVDDGFDLRTNSNHCGACNNACARNEFCREASCIIRLESLCFDGFDDDGNGLTDCEDPSCDQRACGAACVCSGRKKAEDLCSDGLDNEQDSLTDCADDDCAGKACRAGCTCATDGGQLETDCTDGVDNDLDALTDCTDPDCVNQFCTPPEIYFRCTASQQCRCNGGVQIAEVGSVLCRDGVDNDCDGEIDCAESTCTGQSCSLDGGSGTCECFNGAKKETSCANLLDDDGDALVDCADTDCVQGTTCQQLDGGAGSCGATASCD